MTLPADLSRNLIHAFYTTLTHNQAVLAYLGGFVLSAVLAVWKPNRFSILLLLGFGVLGFVYEYDKHLSALLIRQTIQVVVGDPAAHLRAQRYIQTFLGELVPTLFFALGWGLVYLGIILGVKNFPPQGRTQKPPS